MATYRTVQGDTWDLIAYRLWENEYLCWELMDANTKLIHTSIFDSNTILEIPEIVITEKSDLPPWRR